MITGRFKNVFKTSFVRYECLKDVSQTACAYWHESLESGYLYQDRTESFIRRGFALKVYWL